MTAAYSAFATGGMRPTPHVIRRVETADGEVLLSARPNVQRAVSEATAFLMTSILSDVVNGGTGWQARRFGFTHPAAGKTGTTNDFHDAWFVGYTPHLATGVWVGYDQPRTIMNRGYAATVAVPLWGRFMAHATADHPATPFARPRSVTTARICRLSGTLATEACDGAVTVDASGEATSGSMTYTEYFARGTEPVDYCPFHTAMPAPMLAAPVATVAITSAAPLATVATTSAAPAVPVHVATTGQAAPAAVPDAAPPIAPGAQTEPTRQRRGFFDWLLRRGQGGEGQDGQQKPN
jgi:membrane carboxypeptidase/penicillin-binding protein